jgi:hypothetical protein
MKIYKPYVANAIMKKAIKDIIDILKFLKSLGSLRIFAVLSVFYNKKGLIIC